MLYNPDNEHAERRLLSVVDKHAEEGTCWCVRCAVLAGVKATIGRSTLVEGLRQKEARKRRSIER